MSVSAALAVSACVPTTLVAGSFISTDSAYAAVSQQDLDTLRAQVESLEAQKDAKYRVWQTADGKVFPLQTKIIELQQAEMQDQETVNNLKSVVIDAINRSSDEAIPLYDAYTDQYTLVDEFNTRINNYEFDINQAEINIAQLEEELTNASGDDIDRIQAEIAMNRAEIEKRQDQLPGLYDQRNNALNTYQQTKQELEAEVGPSTMQKINQLSVAQEQLDKDERDIRAAHLELSLAQQEAQKLEEEYNDIADDLDAARRAYAAAMAEFDSQEAAGSIASLKLITPTTSEENISPLPYKAFKLFDADITGDYWDDDAPTGSNITSYAGPVLKHIFTDQEYLDKYGLDMAAWLTDKGYEVNNHNLTNSQLQLEFISDHINHRPGEGLTRSEFGMKLAKALWELRDSPYNHITYTQLNSDEDFKQLEGQGYYLIVRDIGFEEDRAAEAERIPEMLIDTVSTSPIFAAIHAGENTINLKTALPSITKLIHEDSTNTWTTIADHSNNQIVNYKLIGTVAENVDAYSKYKFGFVDTWSSKKMELLNDTEHKITVKVDGVDITEDIQIDINKIADEDELRVYWEQWQAAENAANMNRVQITQLQQQIDELGQGSKDKENTQQHLEELTAQKAAIEAMYDDPTTGNPYEDINDDPDYQNILALIDQFTYILDMLPDDDNPDPEQLAALYAQLSAAEAAQDELDTEAQVARAEYEEAQNNGSTYELKLTIEDLRALYTDLNADSEVVVEYSCKQIGDIKDSTTAYSDGILNAASLFYSNNPLNPDWFAYTSKTSTTDYSYGINIHKVDKNTGEDLNGVEFSVYNETDKNYLAKDDDGKLITSADPYTWTTEDVMDKDGNITAKGMINIYGVDADEYKINEITPLANYDEMTDDVIITFDTADRGNITTEVSSVNTLASTYDGDTDANVLVKNVKQISLPSTGAAGLGFLALIALIFAIRSSIKRRQNEKAAITYLD